MNKHFSIPKLIIVAIAISFLIVTRLSHAESLQPNMYFSQARANEYFIRLLSENNIQYYIEYDHSNKIKMISWDIEDDRLALEQALKVKMKICTTEEPESIKMLSPEMNDRFEVFLKENGIPYNRKGGYTYYDWKDWVDVQILKRIFMKNELENIQYLQINK